MSHYSIDSQVRQVGYFLLAVLCIFLAPLAGLLGSMFGIQVLVPSAFALFMGGITLIDLLFPMGRFVPWLMRIPSLNGTWVGTLERSGAAGERESHPVTLHVRQTWRRIALTLMGQSSRSDARLAAIQMSTPQTVTIKWVYDSRPRNASVPQPYAYGEGVTELVLTRDASGATLSGHYYSSKLRKGNLVLKLTS